MATSKTKKTKAVIEELVTVAIIDSAGIYHGMEQIKKSDVTSTHVQLPDGCDLPPGKYGWDQKHNCFMPTKDYLLEQRAQGKNRKRGC